MSASEYFKAKDIKGIEN